jgi:hypothetical protein
MSIFKQQLCYDSLTAMNGAEWGTTLLCHIHFSIPRPFEKFPSLQSADIIRSQSWPREEKSRKREKTGTLTALPYKNWVSRRRERRESQEEQNTSFIFEEKTEGGKRAKKSAKLAGITATTERRASQWFYCRQWCSIFCSRCHKWAPTIHVWVSTATTMSPSQSAVCAKLLRLRHSETFVFIYTFHKFLFLN